MASFELNDETHEKIEDALSQLVRSSRNCVADCVPTKAATRLKCGG